MTSFLATESRQLMQIKFTDEQLLARRIEAKRLEKNYSRIIVYRSFLLAWCIGGAHLYEKKQMIQQILGKANPDVTKHARKLLTAMIKILERNALL